MVHPLDSVLPPGARRTPWVRRELDGRTAFARGEFLIGLSSAPIVDASFVLHSLPVPATPSFAGAHVAIRGARIDVGAAGVPQLVPRNARIS